MTDYRLTKEGEEYLKNGLPEKKMVELLDKTPLRIADAREKIKNFDIALQWVKKKNLVKIEKGVLTLVKRVEFPEQDALEKISQGKNVDENILKILIERKLVERIRHDVEKLKKEISGKEIVQLTPQLLKTGLWKKAKGFAQYDTEIPATKRFPGKKQPYRQIIDEFREKLIGLGFVEVRGPLVEMEFWNFDALFIPQDHPARSGLHDTFNVKTTERGKILDKNLWSRVEATHKNGWITGSNGWGQWETSLARRLVLRSQNTALSARTLSKLKRESIPFKMFAIDRVFRHDVIDAKHLIDFDQCEGIVVGEGLNFKHLLGYLKELAATIGIEKIKFKPTYFPFTEPSVEGHVYHPDLGWIEALPAGILRPEVTLPLGIEVPVLAWGIGIGRLAMIKLGINDIRELYSDNIAWLREKSFVK